MSGRSTQFPLPEIDRECRARILAEIFALESNTTREQISNFCVTSRASVLRIAKDRVKTDTKFSRLGLDSAMIVYVQMELEEKLERAARKARQDPAR
ncbi:MAG: acyl carrier protein [Bradyrhizobium sp.]